MRAGKLGDGSVYLPTDDPDALVDAVAALRPRRGETFALYLASESKFDLDRLVASLDRLELSFFGGVFPALIVGRAVCARGAVIQRMPALHEPVLVTDLRRTDLPALAEHLPPGVDHRPSCLVLVDGFADDIPRFLDACFGELGAAVDWIGCGAGHVGGRRDACVFTSEGAYSEAAVVAMTRFGCSVGVRHGWRGMGPPLVANRTEGRVVHELGWRPALDVYLETVREGAGVSLEVADFGSSAKLFPLGLVREEHEDVVRDLVEIVQDGGLRFVGAVPENSIVRILRGDRDDLLAAARSAAEVPQVPPGHVPRAVLVVDCVSRRAALDGSFDEELGLVDGRLATIAHGIETEGVLSCGEIACPGYNHVELLNKTIAIGVFHDGA